jgi:chemotaxis protein CheX
MTDAQTAGDAPEPARLVLPESLDTTAAGPLLTQLIEARGRPLVLDASATRRIGGQCLQILLSASASWKKDRVALMIADPSPEFREGMALLGCPDIAIPQLVQD